MQAECNETCFKLPRRNLSYTNIMQTERNETYSILLRHSLSHAKINIFPELEVH